MAEAIRMPRMSDTMTEGVIVEWHKKVGDQIKPGDLLAEVETDKATMELESYNEGTLLYIGVEKGQAVPVEGILAIVGKKGEDYKAFLEEEKKKTPSGDNQQPNAEVLPKKNPNEEKAIAEKQEKQSDNKPADVTQNVELPKGAKVIRMPLMSDTMTEGKIIQWNKKVGDKVKADDSLAEVETDKATMDVVGYEEGTLLYIGVEAGKSAKVNDIIAIVGKEGTDVKAFVEAQKHAPKESKEKEEKPEVKSTAQSSPARAVEPTATVQPSSTEGGRVKASPLAKKLAEEKGIDISQVQGSGDGGRIVKRDVDSYVPAAAPKQEAKKAPAEAKPLQPFTQIGQESYEDIPNSQMRKTIARRLGESKFQAPHFYLTMEINMDNAITSRKSINELSPVKVGNKSLRDGASPASGG